MLKTVYGRKRYTVKIKPLSLSDFQLSGPLPRGNYSCQDHVYQFKDNISSFVYK